MNEARGSITDQEGRATRRSVSRRRLLKGAAAAAVAAALVSRLGLVKAGTSDHTAAPDPQGKPRPPRQWAMVIDQRKCDGCVSLDQPPQCTEACINGHYVPDGQKWIEVFEVESPGGGKSFMPTPCFQCENAPCVQVCPVGASYQTEEGVVLIDHDRCIGCRFCMAACPYSRRFFNWGQPEVPAAAYFVQYSPEYPVPARKGTAIKCVMCVHRLRQGKLPHCVEGCPMGAIYLGDLVEDVATNGAEVVTLSKFLADNNAYRYKEELGTRPRVYYLPGYGQEFKRAAGDERKLKPDPNWAERGTADAGDNDSHSHAAPVSPAHSDHSGH